MDPIQVYPNYDYNTRKTQQAEPKQFAPKAEALLSVKAPNAKEAKSLFKEFKLWFEKWLKKPHKIMPEKIKDRAETALDIYNSLDNQNKQDNSSKIKVNQII